MVRRHVHRVYVVQPGAKPCEVLGIVTPTDILKVRQTCWKSIIRNQTIELSFKQ
jgi:hypothetical protein